MTGGSVGGGDGSGSGVKSQLYVISLVGFPILIVLFLGRASYFPPPRYTSLLSSCIFLWVCIEICALEVCLLSGIGHRITSLGLGPGRSFLAATCSFKTPGFGHSLYLISHKLENRAPILGFCQP